MHCGGALISRRAYEKSCASFLSTASLRRHAPTFEDRDALSTNQDLGKLDILKAPASGCRIKIRAKLSRSRELDSRFNLPTLFGEKFVLRLLDKGAPARHDNLGLSLILS